MARVRKPFFFCWQYWMRHYGFQLFHNFPYVGIQSGVPPCQPFACVNPLYHSLGGTSKINRPILALIWALVATPKSLPPIMVTRACGMCVYKLSISVNSFGTWWIRICSLKWYSNFLKIANSRYLALFLINFGIMYCKCSSPIIQTADSSVKC